MSKELPIDFLISRSRLNDIRFGIEGNIFWTEKGSDKNHLFMVNDGSAEIISGEYSIRGKVLYGGGEFDVHTKHLVFCDARDEIVKYDTSSKTLKPITPAWGYNAAPSISPSGNWVVYVNSDGETDVLAVAAAHGNTWPRQLVKGADFYLQPGWHPDGEWITWIEWDHPDMPWQSSSVKIGEVGGMQLRLFNETWIAGKMNCAAHQPVFSPDGKWLSYLQQNGEWEDLILYDLEKKERKVLITGKNFMLSTPDWVQGLRSYGWTHDGKSIYQIRYANAEATLWKIDVSSGNAEQIDVGPYRWLTQISVSPDKDAILLFASSPKIPKSILLIEDRKYQVIRTSQDDTSYDHILPDADHIQWTREDGEVVYGLLYMPNQEMDNLPGLVIEVHGGPTMQRSMSYSAEPAFYTSRGFAYLRVNYRGSTGYGQRYRDALNREYCISEVEDVYAGLNYLKNSEKIDSDRVILLGDSSGGTSVLNILRKYPGSFSGAVVCYGIGDLISAARETHKFELHYFDHLIGDLDNDVEKYESRSPLFHTDEIKDTLLLFHGIEDKVVNYAQSQSLYDSLNTRGIPCTLKLYEQEGHGFRNEETIRDYYQSVADFLGKL